ncbi:Piso0_001293 [Millerozyma farinosa CBS 7064]|uniref:ferric-chelate reductase (NADPH) n=1 Tax=Pichia sorbitophila (strain ATCC MYA-4447 / BCRC 22081 / CBS 7064 / NBRC 10061 / NRRL Y-12695) TaxID=559304 RepID=G8YMS3_PICSO|nr:Piso0_001293 [Millerozyma farinosa CBS 7064]
MGLWKRNRIYKGFDCVADAHTPEYMALKKQSQAQVPWADQPKYGKYTIYFGIVVIFIAFMKHVWYSAQDRRNRKIGGGAGNSFVDVITAYSRFIGYKQLPMSLCYYTSLPESLGSTLFLFISTLYLFCWCFVPHFWYRECRGFGSPPLAVRAGIMGAAVTPFVYILSGKSNMITLVTGVSYEKLNKFHQYVGLVAFVFGIVHTIPFIYQILRDGGTSHLRMKFSTFAYYSGIPPMILLGFLCILSKAWFRKHMYEWFVNLHWAFGIAYFGTLWWHINDQLNMQNYMYAALAFWATQILYRMFIKTTFRPSKLFMRPREAEISCIDDEMLELSVQQHEDLSWKPGQHFFLRFPGTRILDNHPFSICSSSGISGEMKFIIKSKKGLTRVLRKEIETSLTAKKKVYLDGPYGGTSRDPLAFNKVVLLSSGSGVSATIPFLTTLAQKIDESKGSSSVLREIHFIWVVRHRDNINWVLRDLNQVISQDNNIVKIDIYVCRDQETETVNTKLSEDSLEKSIENVKEIEKGMNIIPCKPNVTEIMYDLKLDLKERTMFVLSGSDSLKREVQRNIADYQPLIFNSDMHNLGIREAYLHTESFR